MVEGAFIDSVEQGDLHTMLVYNMDELAKSTRSVSALKRQILGNMSISTPITAIDKEHLDRTLGEFRFG